MLGRELRERDASERGQDVHAEERLVAAWSSVAAADLSQDTRGYAVRLRVGDGTVIDTRGKVFIGLSEYELYRFAGLHRAR